LFACLEFSHIIGNLVSSLIIRQGVHHDNATFVPEDLTPIGGASPNGTTFPEPDEGTVYILLSTFLVMEVLAAIIVLTLVPLLPCSPLSTKY
jgi:hypothetical protein